MNELSYGTDFTRKLNQEIYVFFFGAQRTIKAHNSTEIHVMKIVCKLNDKNYRDIFFETLGNKGQMHLTVVAIQAVNIPKMGFLTKTDPYLVIKLSSDAREFRTNFIENTLNPVWKQRFEFDVNDRETDSIIVVLKDWDSVDKHKIISQLSIPLRTIPLNQENDMWFDMNPCTDKATGGKVRLIIRILSGDDMQQVPRVQQNMMDPNFRDPRQAMTNPQFMQYGFQPQHFQYPGRYQDFRPVQTREQLQMQRRTTFQLQRHGNYPGQTQVQYPAQQQQQFPYQYGQQGFVGQNHYFGYPPQNSQFAQGQNFNQRMPQASDPYSSQYVAPASNPYG